VIVFAPKSFQRRLDRSFQRLQIFVDYSPDENGINAIIFMSQYVSHRANLRPRLVRYDALYRASEFARSF